jgi:arylsulfatase A-like enzyme
VALVSILVLCLSIAVLAIMHSRRRYNQTKPNVIILLIDTLRKDHMSLYGYHRTTTPYLDKFAQDAQVFQNAITSCSWTSPAVASLFTGLYPSTHGCVSFSSEGKEKIVDILDDRLVTFAEILKKNGYLTGAFVASPWICKRLQFDAGFDVFDPIAQKFKPRAHEVNRKALEWISQNRDNPFFVYLHYMDVHGPYRPPEPYDRFFSSDNVRSMSSEETERLNYLSDGREKDKNDLNFYIDRYDGEIRYCDHHIEKLIDRLNDYGLLENSIVVITADHGEAFFDHGFCDHGWSLYNEEIDIPLIIKFPETKIPSHIDRSKVELVDIYSSILPHINCKLPYKTDGKNLFKRSGYKQGDSRAVFSEEPSNKMLGPPKIAMMFDEFKAIYMVNKRKVTELYDLKKDYPENNNLVNIFKETNQEFEQKIMSWQKERQKQRKKLKLGALSVSFQDAYEIERLESLGYIRKK